MEERKLTDEEWFEKVFVKTVELMETFCKNRKELSKDIDIVGLTDNEEESVKGERKVVNYVRSLQAENKRLSDKAIALEVETNNQQAEIERLKNAKADGVRELLQELIEMEIKLDPLRSGIRYKALIGYAEENGVEVE